MTKIFRAKWLKRALIGLVAMGLAGLGSVALINAHVTGSTQNRILTAEEAAQTGADCILVLGSYVAPGGQPSALLAERLDTGIALYGAGASNRLLMSGDHGRTSYDEVNAMKSYAMITGIPSEHVFMDHAGFSTYESLYRARDIFEAERIIIVTQAYHLPRALYVGEKLGLECYGVASDSREIAGADWREGREVLARVKDFFTGILKPKPTYLGEAIPVSGDGNLTNDRPLEAMPTADSASRAA